MFTGLSNNVYSSATANYRLRRVIMYKAARKHLTGPNGLFIIPQMIEGCCLQTQHVLQMLCFDFCLKLELFVAICK